MRVIEYEMAANTYWAVSIRQHSMVRNLQRSDHVKIYQHDEIEIDLRQLVYLLYQNFQICDKRLFSLIPKKAVYTCFCDKF